MSFISKYKHGNELIALLLNHDYPLSLNFIMTELQLSRRSVLYLLKNINQELTANDCIAIQSKKNVGYSLTADTKKKLFRLSRKLAATSIWHTPKDMLFPLASLKSNERAFIINYLTITNPPISINDLVYTLQASRNTILHELQAMTKFNVNNGFTISNSSKGRIIDGSETAIRQWILENCSIIITIVERFYNLQFPEDIIQILTSYEKQLSSKLTDEAKRNLSFYLTWYFQRLKNNFLLTKSAVKTNLHNTLTQQWARYVLNEKKITNPYETAYLASIMNIHAFTTVNIHDPLYNRLYKFAKQLAHQFEILSGLSLNTANHVFLDSLTVHLVSVYHRLQNGIRYNNPLLNKFRHDYCNLFYISKTAIRAIENTIPLHFSDDEIALIATYFGSAIINEHNDYKDKQILVICSSGIGTSQFLLLQLRKKYPQLHFTGPLSLTDCQHLTFNNVGLILTTMPAAHINFGAIPCLNISPLPTANDWKNLYNTLIALDFAIQPEIQENIHQLIDLISDYAKIENLTGLTQSLNNYFYQKNQPDLINTTNISAFMEDSILKYTNYLPAPASWQQAIALAFKPLLQGNFIHHCYIERIIDLINEHSNYMMLGKGIMLAHAKSEDGVLISSASLTLFSSPVPGIDGRNIRCIICLAPLNKTDHLNFLSLLLQKLNDELWCQNLFNIRSQLELNKFIWQN